MINDSNDAFYVYGFTQAGLAPEAAGAAVAESGVSPSLFSVGIDEPHPPFFRRSGRVAAILSRVAQSEFCGPTGEKNLQDLAWLAPRACRHEAVLEQVMRLGAVLPARFGTLFSSTASLESFMRQHEDAIRRFLERGGVLAWGLVPTGFEAFTRESQDHLIGQLESVWAALAAAGIDRDQLLAQSLLSPATCCLINPDREKTVAQAYTWLREVSHRLRDQYHLE